MPNMHFKSQILQNLNFLTLQQIRLPNSLPAGQPYDPVPLWLGLQFFHTITAIMLDLRNRCSEERLSTTPWYFLLSFIS